MTGDTAVDAIVVGSGPNGLTAAAVLARAGLSVAVYEAADTIGGGTRTEEVTLPGFWHDVCSAVHPSGARSPAFEALRLVEHGLEWLNSEIPLAHPFPDGSAAVLHRSFAATVESLGIDGRAYRRLIEPFIGRWGELAPDILGPLTRWPGHPLLMAGFGIRGAWPAGVVKRMFTTEHGRGLFAGLAAHSIAPLTTPMSTGVAMVFALTAHEGGWPVARGGSARVTDALASLVRQAGGEIHTGRTARSLDDLPRARAYVLDVMPDALARIAGERLPASYRRRLGKYRRGPSVFKMDFALREPVPWAAEECRRAATVHVGASDVDIGSALSDVRRGRAPDPPFLIAAQPTIVDPSRAPAGRHTLWVYAHVPNGWRGDHGAVIERHIERFAPGFRDVVLASASTTPADIEARNANSPGGDIGGGAFQGRQTFFRPVVTMTPHATPDPSIYLCSAATPPGAGVHGMGGWHAAQLALRRVFGIGSR